MIVTTKDIFYLVLSICILWITTFTCWLLYYAIAMARDVNRLRKHIESTFTSMHSMMHNAFTGAGLIKDGVELAMKYAKSRKDKKKKKRDEEDEE